VTKFAALAGLLLALMLSACVPARPGQTPPARLDAIEASLARHIAVLASDEFEGRRPGTEGEVKTLRYLAREWQAAGLVSGTNDPANPWFAPVDLVMATPATGSVAFTERGRTLALPTDAVTVLSWQARDLVSRVPTVFLGSQAAIDPLELAGRGVVVSLAGAEPFERVEKLSASGAAAVIVVGTRAQFDPIVAARAEGAYRLAGEDRPLAPIVLVEREAALRQPGVDRLVERLREAGAREGGAVPLPYALSLDTRTDLVEVRTHNLIARLPGRDPAAGAVLLLAHWDHFGQCGPADAPDRLCNGAVDNASGLAMLTEIARALAAGQKLDRDVYFLATTAEEWGLLGAYAFTREPPVPLDTIVAAFNLDTSALAARGAPVALVGEGLGPLDAEVMQVIAAAGRRIEGRDVARDYVRRQDGWALVQADVPTLMVSSSFANRELLERYTRERYHQAADKPEGVKLGGAAEDLVLHLALVRHFADLAAHPAPTGENPPAP
jgi:aminopeptidase YwaD